MTHGIGLLLQDGGSLIRSVCLACLLVSFQLVLRKQAAARVVGQEHRGGLTYREDDMSPNVLL